MTNDAPIAAANDNTGGNTAQRDAKRLMVTLTRLLVGDRGDPHGPAFNATLMVMVGAPLATNGLLWLADLARLNRRHVIHLSFQPGCALPRLAFAHRRGEIVTVHEHCFLMLRPKEDRAAIVPGSFTHGAFQLTAGMTLRRHKAPASFDAALPPITRAYERFDALIGAAAPDDDWQPIRVSCR